ncbi:aminoacyl-tRNA hydrolase [Lederbergia lenta]|uniref:aminoacyl-tRNA hydrolase n=1 Tax=Lederbergia lenta TaxID=1467 RepID=UPI00203B7B82|nr:aminoacyl-tRNA hydrolase [Lederbergia lenta]MCM3109919.1 peptidyl-tRNA hydrolase [Lederbergia lenta]
MRQSFDGVDKVNDYRMYILVNEDIKISKGKLAGQVGHAVMGYIYHNAIKPLQEGKQIESLDDYMKEQKKIILKCPQWRLEELEEQGCYTVIRDKGYTQLEPDTLTCVNIGILFPDNIAPWVKELKLYN